MPFSSPDGRWVGFWSSGALKKIPIDGSGPATMICETTLPYGASWGADDTIIFSRGREGLWRVPAAGGTAQAIIKPDTTKGELKLLSPQFLPGDEAILFTVTHTPFPTWEDDTEVVVQVLASGERKVLVHGGADGRYLPSGHLLYLRKSTLMAVPFDLQRLAATGGAVALIADVMQSANTPNEASESGAGQFSVSEHRVAPLCVRRHVSRSGTFVGVGRQERRRRSRCRYPRVRICRRASHPTAVASSSGRRETAMSGCTISHAA